MTRDINRSRTAGITLDWREATGSREMTTFVMNPPTKDTKLYSCAEDRGDYYTRGSTKQTFQFMKWRAGGKSDVCKEKDTSLIIHMLTCFSFRPVQKSFNNFLHIHLRASQSNVQSFQNRGWANHTLKSFYGQSVIAIQSRVCLQIIIPLLDKAVL